METIYLNRDNLQKWQTKAKPKVMALGCFDGLHNGHCKVIKTAYEKAKEKNVPLAVMSFFPHPKTVISNGQKQVPYLMPLPEKEKRLRNLGVDIFYIAEFDKKFASLPPKQFVAQYMLQLGVIHAVAGFDFCYGSRGEGNMDRLYRDSDGQIEVTKVAKVGYRDEKISSTRIRERLLSGHVEEIPPLLGNFYVVKCDWDGYQLKPEPHYTLPAPGRYAVVLKNARECMHTEVMIAQSEAGLSVTCEEKIPFSIPGKLSLVWLRHLEADHQAIYQNILIS